MLDIPEYIGIAGPGWASVTVSVRESVREATGTTGEEGAVTPPLTSMYFG